MFVFMTLELAKQKTTHMTKDLHCQDTIVANRQLYT